MTSLQKSRTLFNFNALGTTAGSWTEDGSGLLETLVKAIGVEHDGLAEVRRIVEHLRAAERSRPEGGAPSVLPEGFDELWESVWTAYTTKQREHQP
jgi:hypothetical protein